MTNIKVELKDYYHLKDISIYNRNYYRHKEYGDMLYVECNEDEGVYRVYTGSGNNKAFLFCCDTQDDEVLEGVLFWWLT